jgi:hypothetical protein
MKNIGSIGDVFSDAVLKLKSFQQNGEFNTYAINTEGNVFYIGESPFITSHIICLLAESKSSEVQKIIHDSVRFIKKLCDNKFNLYKFWYKNTFGTAFARLPYDMDDTAMALQVLCLTDNNQKFNLSFIKQNVDENNRILTWWRPDLKTIISNLTEIMVFLKHYSSYLIFKKNKDGLTMADYNDSELIVRLNNYTLFEILKQDYTFNENHIPVELEEVRNELACSLHYMNETVYFYTISRYHYYSKKLSEVQVNKLIESIQALINLLRLKGEKLADILLLYVCLVMLDEIETFYDEIHQFIVNNKFDECSIMVCVGNKKFDNYHQYFSFAFTYAAIVFLVCKLDTHKNNVNLLKK